LPSTGRRQGCELGRESDDDPGADPAAAVGDRVGAHDRVADAVEQHADAKGVRIAEAAGAGHRVAADHVAIGVEQEDPVAGLVERVALDADAGRHLRPCGVAPDEAPIDKDAQVVHAREPIVRHHRARAELDPDAVAAVVRIAVGVGEHVAVHAARARAEHVHAVVARAGDPVVLDDVAVARPAAADADATDGDVLDLVVGEPVALAAVEPDASAACHAQDAVVIDEVAGNRGGAGAGAKPIPPNRVSRTTRWWIRLSLIPVVSEPAPTPSSHCCTVPPSTVTPS
jgi:hypothetical protein